jgi:hypothetical protein
VANHDERLYLCTCHVLTCRPSVLSWPSLNHVLQYAGRAAAGSMAERCASAAECVGPEPGPGARGCGRPAAVMVRQRPAALWCQRRHPYGGACSGGGTWHADALAEPHGSAAAWLQFPPPARRSAPARRAGCCLCDDSQIRQPLWILGMSGNKVQRYREPCICSNWAAYRLLLTCV